MKIKIQYLCLLLICLVAVAACKTVVRVSTENMAYSYKEDFSPFCKSAYIIHRNDSISELVLHLMSDDFLYNKEQHSDTLTSNISVGTYLLNSLNDKHWIDSTNTNIQVKYDSTNAIKIFKLPLKIIFGKNYYMYVSVTDNNTNIKQSLLIDINKSNKYNAQWFEPSQNLLNIPSAYIINKDSQIFFEYNGDMPENLKCYFYKDSFAIPSPPYVLENITAQKINADSVFCNLSAAENKFFSFTTFSRGIYFFSSDHGLTDGFTVLCTSAGFPNISSHEDMIKPIRYITARKEYENIAKSSNKTEAIESFWLKIGGHEDRAKNLIKKYYGRVTNANRLFSSYIQGWQTDRGMIFIIFGVPNFVYRSDESEIWIYGEENNFFSTTFTFKKVKNKFSDNDYILQRNPTYKDNWFRAVDFWRQ